MRSSSAHQDEPRQIRLLSPELANQIAAGEVVERAASVVKELVENAIDAGATRIDVDIEAGGRRLIRVSDDGCGMTATQARLAVQRFATSKLDSESDLWTLGTFGFRGEALPSIAAVSRLSLATRSADQDTGHQLDMEGASERGDRAVGMPIGTRIEVRDLFFNTPARQKFQKTENTESAHVSETLLRLALSHPSIHLRLRNAGRSVLDLPPHRDQAERVRAALQRRGARLLHQAVGEESGVRVNAFVAPPEQASSTARNTFLMVGRRFVRDRSLLQAVVMGYGDTLDRGRYPLAVVFVDAPSSEVDVNVHPQKLEVRFSQPQRVCAAVRHVISAGLSAAPWQPAEPIGVGGAQSPFSTTPRHEGSADTPGRMAERRTSQPKWPQPEPFSGGPSRAPAPTFPWQGKAAEGVSSRSSDVQTSANAGQMDVPAAPSRPSGILSLTRAFETLPAPRLASRRFGQSRYLGQFGDAYLLCEAEGGLVIVNQHRAHQAVAQVALLGSAASGVVPSTPLLFPIPVGVTEEQGLWVEQNQGFLARIGIEVDSFDAQRVAVRALPSWLPGADPKPVVLAALSGAVSAEIRSGDDARALERAVQGLAKAGAVRPGELVTESQGAALIRLLDFVPPEQLSVEGVQIMAQLSTEALEGLFRHG